MWRFNRWKPTTPAECAVLVLLFAAVFVVLGLVAIVAGLQAPAEKHDAAVGLMHIGFWLLGLGVAVAACYWLYRRLAD
jgi:hypothetical protein